MVNDSHLDRSEKIFQYLGRAAVDIYKLCLEEMGYDLYTSVNVIDYHNFAAAGIPLTIGGGPTGPTDFGPCGSLDGLWFPDTVRINQRIPKSILSSELISIFKQASAETGVPVLVYILHGILENSLGSGGFNRFGYGGMFGQRAGQGGSGDILSQCKGAIVTTYNDAIRTNKSKGYNFTGADLYVWCYLVHNCGLHGAITYVNALNGRLRYPTGEPYRYAAEQWAKLDKRFQLEQHIVEKTHSPIKAFYVYKQAIEYGWHNL